MRHVIAFVRGFIRNKAQINKIKRLGIDVYKKQFIFYAGKNLFNISCVNEYLKSNILSGKPLCIARFGSTELFCASMFEFDFRRYQKKAINQLYNWSGFFPKKRDLGEKFNKCIIDSCSAIDLLGVWNQRYEEYYINHYMQKTISLTYLDNLEPWKYSENPWTKALKGKKVLIIHPFENTIKKQYKRREQIFPGTDILPEFELKTLKAVQTLVDEQDKRFGNWFEALEWMFCEAMKIDFDIAIIGCGAYGMPLAAKIKNAGKQAIHLGGATQILFGIRGKRWDMEVKYDYVRKWYNDSWVYPEDSEKPKNAASVEGACYW